LSGENATDCPDFTDSNDGCMGWLSGHASIRAPVIGGIFSFETFERIWFVPIKYQETYDAPH
jgi:hypothetical protein